MNKGRDLVEQNKCSEAKMKILSNPKGKEKYEEKQWDESFKDCLLRER